MKVSELTGAALDWAVAKCNGHLDDETIIRRLEPDEEGWCIAYSTDWSQGGPIIERCCINVYYDGGGYWCATTDSGDPPRFGPTPLIAAMRCYVASQMGAEIELPEELK
jgi:hypothetical protein